MHLTLRLLGFEVLSVEYATDDEYAEGGCSLDGGTTAAYPIGFAPSEPQPWDMDCPPHVTFPE